MGMGMRSHANGGYAHSHARSGSSSDATDHRNGGVRQTWLAKPDDKAAADEHEAPDDEAPMRMREFALVYATYMALLACRRNYGFWLPSVLSRLGKSKGEAGAVGSAFEMAYGACSLLNGVLIDSRSPRALLITGLVLTGIINVAVSVTDVLPAMAALWAVNGAVQSLGWPSVTNVFLAWFPDPAARGAWYSLLSTCQNAGAALVPLVVVASINSFGWRAALWTPALLAVCMALLLALLLHGSPAEARAAAARRATGVVLAADEVAAQKPRAAAPLASALGRQVLLNRALWVMAASYFSVSLVRSFLSDWSTTYLTESKGLTLPEVARCLFLLEAGGFGGSLAAGALSDRLFAGRRGPVVALCSALLAPLMLLLHAATRPLALHLIYAGLGFCAFPVHVLLGLFSREVVPPAVSSSAGGFVKCIAQLGGAFAGYPLGRLQQSHGWAGVQVALAATSVVSAVVASTLWTTTAAGRINGRHGTVQDFTALKRASGAPHKSKSM